MPCAFRPRAEGILSDRRLDVTAPDSQLPQEAGVSTGFLASGWAYGDIAMVLEMCRLTAASIPLGEAAKVTKKHS